MFPRFLLVLFAYQSIYSATSINISKWCSLGCNVWLHDSFMYHCVQIDDHELPKQIILSYPTNIEASSQCLYHSPSYAYNGSISNITTSHNDAGYDGCTDCIDWHNGCTECLCLHDTNTSLCNLNLNGKTCTAYTQPNCQTSDSDLSSEYPYDVSMLLWFSILDINTEYELWLPLAIITDLQSILTQYIFRHTVFHEYTQNISCHMLYPYGYMNYYKFIDSNGTQRINISQLFNRVLPVPSPNNTESNDTLFSTTEFIDLTLTPNVTTPSPVLLDTFSEYDAKFYNYMPQCAFSFDTKSHALQFMTAFRNHSNTLRQNLHSIITFYMTHNVSLLLSVSEDTNETLYDFIQDNEEYLHIQYINDTAQIANENHTLDYPLTLNRSLYSIQLNLIHYYFGNLSHQIVPTLSPTMSPTKPRDCWFDGKQIQHNTTYYRNQCYFVSCDNGDVQINDKYCDTDCYNKTLNKTQRNNTCCVTTDGIHCGEENDDCPMQNDCSLCLSHQRTCSWNGDHCSAVCVGEYCWFNDECPAILIIRLHLKGITIKQANDNEGFINHAIASSLDITENLIKNYFPTQTPDNELIELKKTISVTEKDEERIPEILTDDNTGYVERLNEEIVKAFQSVPGIRSTIEVVDVEYGGLEGSEQDSSSLDDTQNGKWVSDNAFVILLGCGALVMITICGLCYRYPVLSYCCCCIPIKVRRLIKNWSRNYCCLCCQQFTFGVLYEDDVSDLIKRRREERRRNLHVRNEIIEEQHHLNANQEDVQLVRGDDGHTEHKEHEDYHPLKSVKKDKKRKKKKKKRKRKKSKSDTHDSTNNTIHDDVVETKEIAMTTLRSKKHMLYYDHDRDVIEED